MGKGKKANDIPCSKKWGLKNIYIILDWQWEKCRLKEAFKDRK